MEVDGYRQVKRIIPEITLYDWGKPQNTSATTTINITSMKWVLSKCKIHGNVCCLMKCLPVIRWLLVGLFWVDWVGKSASKENGEITYNIRYLESSKKFGGKLLDKHQCDIPIYFNARIVRVFWGSQPIAIHIYDRIRHVCWFVYVQKCIHQRVAAMFSTALCQYLHKYIKTKV